MSRRDLLNSCQRIGVRIDNVANGKRVSKVNETLRMDIIEGTYGVGMHWQFKTAAEADATCIRAVDCFTGKLGYLLAVSQMALRSGTQEIAEAKRLAGLKRNHIDKRAELLISARQWLEISRIAQELHATACGIKETVH